MSLIPVVRWWFLLFACFLSKMIMFQYFTKLFTNMEQVDEVTPEENFVGRVYQNDAETLNKEALAAIQNQINDGVKYLMPNLYLKIEPEVLALLQLVIWRHTVLSHGQTFGQQLLGVSYVRLTTRRAVLLALLTVGGGWLQRRLPDLLTAVPAQRREQVRGAADAADLLVRLASLLNLLLFLRGGLYPTLAERLLRLRKRRVAQDLVSETNYTYLTREYLWRGFSELLMCVLPLVDLRALRAAVLRVLPVRLRAAPAMFDGRCVWCAQPPVLPHALQCCHLACYYCLQAAPGGRQIPCAQCGRESDRTEVQPVPVVKRRDG